MQAREEFSRYQSVGNLFQLLLKVNKKEIRRRVAGRGTACRALLLSPERLPFDRGNYLPGGLCTTNSASLVRVSGRLKIAQRFIGGIVRRQRRSP